MNKRRLHESGCMRMGDLRSQFKYQRNGAKPFNITTSVFGYNQQTALEDSELKKFQGKQNRRHGTQLKKIQKIAKASRKRNRLARH